MPMIRFEDTNGNYIAEVDLSDDIFERFKKSAEAKNIDVEDELRSALTDGLKRIVDV